MYAKGTRNEYFNRVNSAPPDEGEPDLKNIQINFNLFAKEFKLNSGPAANTSAKKTAEPKKELRADAAVFEPSNKNLSASSPVFELSFKSFSTPYSEPELTNNEKKDSGNNDSLSPIPEASNFNKVLNSKDTPESTNDVTTQTPMPNLDTQLLDQQNSTSTIPEQSEIPKILSVVNETQEDQILPYQNSLIKTSKGKKGEEKKIVREVIGQVQWRKAKTAEEEKISKKAKEYTRRYTATQDEQEKIKKQVRVTLNKLSSNNLEKLSREILETSKKSHDCLKLVVSGIFEKAWSENKYTQMYSGLCKFLKSNFENYKYSIEDTKLPSTKNYFKYELLYMCEETFQYNPDENDFTGLSDEIRKEKLSKLKKKTLGNARFIGELFNVNLITTKITLECVNSLLELYERENNEDKLEGAFVILQTGGISFERPKVKLFSDEIYQRLDRFSRNPDLSSKNKFKIVDLQDFRHSRWKNLHKEELKKVEEIHADFQNEILRKYGHN